MKKGGGHKKKAAFVYTFFVFLPLKPTDMDKIKTLCRENRLNDDFFD